LARFAIFECVFEGRGGRKIDHPGGRENHACFEKMSYGKRESCWEKWVVERNILFGRQNGEAFKATRVR
jgi:hypothetical protein